MSLEGPGVVIRLDRVVFRIGDSQTVLRGIAMRELKFPENARQAGVFLNARVSDATAAAGKSRAQESEAHQTRAGGHGLFC